MVLHLGNSLLQHLLWGTRYFKTKKKVGSTLSTDRRALPVIGWGKMNKEIHPLELSLCLPTQGIFHGNEAFDEKD